MKKIILILCIGVLIAGYFVYLPQKQNPKIIAFGDSLTYGVGSKQGGGFVTLLSQDLHVPIENLGVPGDTTADALVRIDDVLVKKPDIALVLFGGNDLLQNVSAVETAKNLALINTRLKSAGVKVLLLKLDLLQEIWGHPELMSDNLHPNDKGYALMAARIEPELRKLFRP